MTRDEVIARLGALRPWLAETHGVTRLAVFGSHARDEARPDSDIDVVAAFADTPSLIELVGIEMELSERLGRPVDLATFDGLKPRARARILAEAVDV